MSKSASYFLCVFQELKEDNRVLLETKEVLEDQLAGWRARSDKIHQLEKHSLLLKAQVHDMEQVRRLHTNKFPLTCCAPLLPCVYLKQIQDLNIQCPRFVRMII